MSELKALDIKAFVPSKDFEKSKQFYQDLGFTLCWGDDNLAYLHYGDHAEGGPQPRGFLLQNFYVKEAAENLMLHLLVEDADAWWALVQERKLIEKYGVMGQPPEDRAWGLRDFVIADPSGVLWRIAQDINKA